MIKPSKYNWWKKSKKSSQHDKELIELLSKKWIELKIGYQSNNVACFLQNHYATNRFETFKLLVALFKYWINGKNWR